MEARYKHGVLSVPFLRKQPLGNGSGEPNEIRIVRLGQEENGLHFQLEPYTAQLLRELPDTNGHLRELPFGK